MTHKTRLKTLLVASVVFWICAPHTFAEEGFCGDGALDPATEQCDDGNHVNRDGCSAYCKTEDMTPPTVASVSIPDGTKDVKTNTDEIVVTFSEPINLTSLNTITNVRLEHNATPMDISLNLASDQKTLTIHLNQDLFPQSSHSLRIQNIKDVPGNIMANESITVFETGTLIDHTPPNVVVDPTGGTFGFAQNVSLTPYLGSYTGSPDYIDTTAKIYYTLDGSTPTSTSELYKLPIPIRVNSTLKYFSVDTAGNRASVKTETYNFDCPEQLNAKRTSTYPTCNILECQYGFVLRGNACVVSLETTAADDYITNAVTAPLFSSSQPMTITSKPSIFITPEHKGLIPRPIVFKDSKRGTVIQFERDTMIKEKDGRAFSGYIKPPVNLYSKDFPINFGYIFRSIFEFKSADGRDLTFKPPLHITLPYSDSFNPEEGVTIFTFNPKTEAYTAYDKKLYAADLAKQQVVITAPKTETFFIAQSGQNFNRSVFKDIKDHWAKNYIEALYRKGIVKGKDDGIFAPNDHMTRAEFIKIALLAAGIEVPNADDIQKAPFRDSPLDAWFTPYLAKAKELGLIKGYKDNSFMPGKLINRAEAIKILLSAFKFDLAPKKNEVPAALAKNFKDLSKSQWYYETIDFALRNKLVDGPKSANGSVLKTFGPDKPITRAEMSKLTIKTIELKEALDKK
jgi:cysteine-rich repeat protein